MIEKLDSVEATPKQDIQRDLDAILAKVRAEGFTLKGGTIEPARKRGRPEHGVPDPWRPICAAAGGRVALAKVLGVHDTTLYRWVKGSRQPDAASLEKITAAAAHFRVRNPIAWLRTP